MRRLKLILLPLFVLSLIVNGCKDNNVAPPIDESNIRLVASYNTNASTNGVCVYSINFRNYAFIADGTNGMQVIDVTSPNSPDSISSFNTGGSANDIYVANINNRIYAFVADYNSGLVVIDVSNVYDPQQLGIVAGIYTSTVFVDASNEIAYAGQSSGPVTIIDIGFLPGSPTILTTVGSNCNGIYSTGNRLYISNGSIGFSIYDVTNPSSPTLLSVTNTTGGANNMVVIQNYAYVADTYNGTLIFNVSNPSSPQLLSKITPYGQVLGVAVNNNTLYTADNTYGVESIDVSNPSAPQSNGHIQLNSSANNIVYFGGYLYLAAAEGGLGILQPAN